MSGGEASAAILVKLFLLNFVSLNGPSILFRV